MVKNMDSSPYFDDYDSSKGYLSILAKPGTTEQAREFTQLQTTIYDHLGRVAHTVLKEGDIVEGCSLVVSGNQATITSGKIFLDGLVHNTELSTLTIPTTGTSEVGAKITYDVITATDDPSLRDPAIGVANQGLPGADRLRATVTYVVDDDSAIPIYRLVDGQLDVEKATPGAGVIDDTLARRTYDESGNYKVSGLEVSDRDESDSNGNILVNVSNGKAYVKGYEVTKPVNSVVSLRVPDDYTSTSNELKRYTVGVREYQLNNKSLKSVKKVSMNTQSEVDITRRSGSNIDILVTLDQSVSSILKVTQGDTVYEYGTDYEISSDRTGINWSPVVDGGSPANGNRPASGSTYRISYVALGNVDSTKYSTETRGDHEFLIFDVSAPVPYIAPNTQFIGTFTVEYDFFYSRKDLIMLGKDGKFSILEGVPNIESKVESPINRDDNLLNLSVVTLSKSGITDIDNLSGTRLTMSDLMRMLSRLNDVETNVAITNLDREARDGEDATLLTGIYTDGFINTAKADINHREYTGAIDLDNQEVTVRSQSSVLDLGINNSSSNLSYVGRVISAPFVSKLLINNIRATETMLVNPYAMFNPMGIIKLTPEVDTWVSETILTENKESSNSSVLRRWWKHKNSNWAEQEKARWKALGFADGGESLNWDKTATGISTSASSSVLDNLTTYMRKQTIRIEGSNYTPNSDNISCLFDSREVPMTPVDGTSAGTQSGTVKADSTGRFYATIVVPDNVKCGTVEVRLTSSNGVGSASYTAVGTDRTITNTVTTTITNVTTVDPLAQSFMFDRDRILTEVGLYFAVKGSSPIIVEIRNMVNGYPGQVCYDRVAVPSSKIVTSNNASVETRIKLNQPVYANADTQYCVAILSDSNEYQVYTSTIGKKLIGSDTYVTSQTDTGVLFSSSNALTWTAHQSSDLTYRLYEAVYNTDGGVVVFDDVTTGTISRILLATDYIDKKNAGVTWEYSLNGGTTWTNIESYADQELEYGYQSESVAKLKATIKVASNTSPMMASDNMSLVTFINSDNFTHVSRNVPVTTPFSKVRLTLESNYGVLSGIDMQVFYATDVNGNNWIELKDPKVTPVDTEFNRFMYEGDLPDGTTATNYRYKIFMKTSNPLIRPRARKVMNTMKIM